MNKKQHCQTIKTILFHVDGSAGKKVDLYSEVNGNTVGNRNHTESINFWKKGKMLKENCSAVKEKIELPNVTHF